MAKGIMFVRSRNVRFDAAAGQQYHFETGYPTFFRGGLIPFLRSLVMQRRPGETVYLQMTGVQDMLPPCHAGPNEGRQSAGDPSSHLA